MAPDTDILSALQGIKCELQGLRKDRHKEATLKNLMAYYSSLPKDIIKRLTALPGELIAQGQGPPRGHSMEEILERLTGAAPYNQIIRAANTYRARIGYAPLGEDGWPIEMDKEDNHGRDAMDRRDHAGAAPGALSDNGLSDRDPQYNPAG